MSKQLRICLFALLGTLLASTTLPVQGVITMTSSKAVGEEIALRIEANGNVTIEGAQETGKTDDLDRKSYRLTSQTITIRGDVTELVCSWNQLTSLDVSKNSALTRLNCSANGLASLNLPKSTALTTLDCFFNQLTSLDVSKNTALTVLGCNSNKLTSLDVSKNTALTVLDCSFNQLTNLNISGCARLEVLFCFSNCINGKAMTKLVNSLPNRRSMAHGTVFLVDRSSKKRDKNRCSAADVTTAKKKNWEVGQLRAF